MNELALFAGAGGGILGGHLLGWRTICAVEWMPYPRNVLMQRQDDGILRPFPIWDDVQTFDGRPWAGLVDVVSGGFPCQDISAAGKGAGIDGERSGMWSHMARIIGEVRPRFAFVENSPMLTSRGLGRVLGDLAAMGYDAEWGVLGVSYFGGWHVRERIWIAAYAAGERRDFGGICESNEKREKREVLESTRLVRGEYGYRPWITCPTEKSRILGMANGVAGELDRIKATGNGQSPIVAAAAFRILTERAGWAA